METCGFVGELRGRQVGEFPQLGLTMVPATFAASIHRRQTLASAKIFHELRGQVGRHASVRSPGLSRLNLWKTEPFKTECLQTRSAGGSASAANASNAIAGDPR